MELLGLSCLTLFQSIRFCFPGKISATKAVLLIHPRRCGANPSSSPPLPIVPDSSPPVRGKPLFRAIARLNRRFIPASAGQTESIRDQLSKKPIHPRRCGANKPANCTSACWGDSSPPVRGKPIVVDDACFDIRFIPAGAGQTAIN